MLTISKNIKLILNYVIGPLVFCFLLFSIAQQIREQVNWETSLYKLKGAVSGYSILGLLGVVILMLLNWLLESMKWKLLILRIQPITAYQSFKATLTGLTFAFFTPNRMGEYMGRVLYIQQGKRIAAASFTIVCSLAQILVTLLFGFTGLLAMNTELRTSLPGIPSVGLWLDVLQYGVLSGLVVLTIFYLRLPWLFSFMGRLPQLKRITGIIKDLQEFDIGLLGRIWLLSVARYLIFVLQYYLMFHIFNIECNLWQVFWSASIVFLVLAVLPSIAFLTDLGVRWKTSLAIFQLVSTDTVGILATTMAIWIINLVLPALAGSLLILNIRLFRLRAKKIRNETAHGGADNAI